MKTGVPLPPREAIDESVANALREDIGGGDLTAALTAAHAHARAVLFAREPAVLCGAAWFAQTFRALDREVAIEWACEDGAQLSRGMRVCEIRGNARALLAAERTAINFLQTLSATASAARKYVDAVGESGARIMDTRKTIPGLRLAQKYATAVGGAHNHRFGLYDQLLIKENHIAAAGCIARALQLAREAAGEHAIEIEVESLAQLREALDAGARRILLDNFDARMLRDAVTLAKGNAVLEASGNISLENVREIADSGVDCISVGAISKNICAVDFSLRFENA